MTRKTLSVILVFLMVIGTVALPVQAEEPVVIKLMAIAGNGGHETIVERFNATHDHIKIELDNSPTSWEDLGTKLITMSAAGMPPDIATVSTSFYPQFAAQDMLLDITDYVEENLNKDEYYWSVIENLYRDGRLYGLPISIYTLMTYYNRDMFEAAGLEVPSLDWSNTWTMDDWIEAGRKMSSGEGLNRIYGAWIEFQLERTAAFMFPEGLDYWGADLYPQFDNQDLRDIHEKLYRMTHEEKIMPDSATTRTTSTVQLFADSKLGMMINGTWTHPEVAESSVNYGILPTPGGTTVGYVDVYIPLAKTEHPEETMEVMLWLIGEEPSTIKYEEFTWGPQVNRAATEKNRDIMFVGLTDDEKQSIFDSLDHNKPLTVFDKWAEFLMASLLPISEMMGIGEYTIDEGFDLLQEEALMITGN